MITSPKSSVLYRPKSVSTSVITRCCNVSTASHAAVAMYVYSLSLSKVLDAFSLSFSDIARMRTFVHMT